MKKPSPPRQQKPTARRDPVTGVAWYTPSEWSRVKATAVDPERFEASFNEWVAMAEEALADMRKVGIVAHKCLVDADALRAWCHDKGVENDAEARSRFVSERMMSSNRADR